MNQNTQELFSLIRSRQLAPGDFIPTERELMELLGLSRSSVREAVRELYAWNIVDMKRGKGVIVSNKSLSVLAPALIFHTTFSSGMDSKKRLSNLLEIRMAIERHFIKDVQESLTSDQVNQLRKVCDKMESDPNRTNYDREFHNILYQNLDNPLVIDLLELFWVSYSESQKYLLGASTYDHENSAQEHRNLVDAYESQDVDTIDRHLVAHYEMLNHRIKNDP